MRYSTIPELTLQSYEQAFEIEYTHNSTAIEGNTLTLIETKLVLEDGISIGGKNLREIYESVNHQKAYRYVKKCIAQGLPLDEKIIKDIPPDHELPAYGKRFSADQHQKGEPAELF